MAEMQTLTGWARTAPSASEVVIAADLDVIREALARARDDRQPGGRRRGLIARGLGRSYGDPAQNAGGRVLDMSAYRQIHRIAVGEGDSGEAVVDAGVSLDQLLRVTVRLGLWLPVMPGTRQVTIGGAIGSDVHGKNHHTAGSFGNHVRSIELLTADGELRTLTPDGPDSDLFWATVGGMGLTGIVLRATIALKRVPTAYFAVDSDRTRDLDETLAFYSDGRDDGYDYSMAWFDSMSTDGRLGRAAFSRGSIADVDQLPKKLRADPLKFDAPQLIKLPDLFPNGLANKITFGAVSKVWYYKTPRRARGQIQNLTSFYHPLDMIGEWNRAYGNRGFLQYQCLLPFDRDDQLRAMIRRIADSGQVSFLNVLKRMGDPNPAPLSFPRPGWTITLDFPVGPGLDRLCADLDAMTAEADGRLYLAKDSRMTPEAFARMYPRLAEWRKIRNAVDPDRIFVSDQARRLGI